MPFTTIAEVAAWAEENGGENGLREALADGRFGANQRSIQLSEEWLRRRDEAALLERQAVALEATARSVDEAKRAAIAAEQSAKWARVAAIFTAVGAIATALGAGATCWQTWLARMQAQESLAHPNTETTPQPQRGSFRSQ